MIDNVCFLHDYPTVKGNKSNLCTRLADLININLSIGSLHTLIIDIGQTKLSLNICYCSLSILTKMVVKSILNLLTINCSIAIFRNFQGVPHI